MKHYLEFEDSLKKALLHYYDTVHLIDNLLKEKRNAQEIILLACSRLDSLSNLTSKNNMAQKNSFVQFLLKFSGEGKFFNQISIGDLYSYLFYYGLIAEGGLVEIPGRIQKFGRDSSDFILFIEKSGIPITGKTVRQLSHRIARILEENYRVRFGQRLSKKYLASFKDVKKVILREFKSPQPEIISRSIDHLLERFKICSIFYEKYRCGVIHGYKIVLDEEGFFTKIKPFHSALRYIYGDIFHIQFPGEYLEKLLSHSLKTLFNHLMANRKLPSDLFFEAFDLDEGYPANLMDKYLDNESLEEFEEIKWQLK